MKNDRYNEAKNRLEIIHLEEQPFASTAVSNKTARLH